MNSMTFVNKDFPYPEKNVNIRKNIGNVDYCMKHGTQMQAAFLIKHPFNCFELLK